MNTRRMFETWLRNIWTDGYQAKRFENEDRYVDQMAQNYWECWQAALAQRTQPVAVAYADPQAFKNFAAGTASNEWMWAKPDTGLVPLYTNAAPQDAQPAAKVKTVNKVKPSKEAWHPHLNIDGND